MQDLLGNQLALTVGYLELIGQDPQLPPALRGWLDEAMRGAQEAAETVHRLAALQRLVEAPHGPGEEPRLDLRRSTGA
jgi:hypothetical protein